MKPNSEPSSQNSNVDPEFVAIAGLVVSSISMLLAVRGRITTARSAQEKQQRRTAALSVNRNLIAVETRVQQIQTAFKAILEKGGTSIDSAEMRFGQANVEFDPATFGFVTQELDRLINSIRNFQNALAQALTAMVRGNIRPDNETLRELQKLETLCNGVIW